MFKKVNHFFLNNLLEWRRYLAVWGSRPYYTRFFSVCNLVMEDQWLTIQEIVSDLDIKQWFYIYDFNQWLGLAQSGHVNAQVGVKGVQTTFIWVEWALPSCLSTEHVWVCQRGDPDFMKPVIRKYLVHRYDSNVPRAEKGS